ncbi:MAG: hypothetical protein ABIF71_04285 [Planctomycetota bacterium]
MPKTFFPVDRRVAVLLQRLGRDAQAEEVAFVHEREGQVEIRRRVMVSAPDRVVIDGHFKVVPHEFQRPQHRPGVDLVFPRQGGAIGVSPRGQMLVYEHDAPHFRFEFVHFPSLQSGVTGRKSHVTGL